MSHTLHLHRPHDLGLEGARAIARRWISEAESVFGLRCRSEPGVAGDRVHFERPGVRGTLQVAADGFTLDAQLGFLLAGFAPRIEAEIARNLDELLGAARQGDAM